MAIPSQYLIPIYDDLGNVVGYDYRASLFAWLNAITANLNELNSDLSVLRKDTYWNALTESQRIALKAYIISKLSAEKTGIDSIILEIQGITVTTK